MEQLKAAGTTQNRKVYARHGAAEPMFGVSYADLGRIAKPRGPPLGHRDGKSSSYVTAPTACAIPGFRTIP